MMRLRYFSNFKTFTLNRDILDFQEHFSSQIYDISYTEEYLGSTRLRDV